MHFLSFGGICSTEWPVYSNFRMIITIFWISENLELLQTSLDKQCRPRLDCSLKGSLIIRAYTICNSVSIFLKYRKMVYFRVAKFSRNFTVGRDPRKLKSAKYIPSLSKVKAIIHKIRFCSSHFLHKSDKNTRVIRLMLCYG